jgi:hypothetical protein
LEDDEHTSQPRTVRTKLKIQEAATLVCANCSQMVDEIAAAAAAAAAEAEAGISHGTCHKILSDELNMSCVTQHSVGSVARVLTQGRDDRTSMW